MGIFFCACCRDKSGTNFRTVNRLVLRLLDLGLVQIDLLEEAPEERIEIDFQFST